MSKSNRSLGKPASTKDQPSPKATSNKSAKRFKARAIDTTVAVKELTSRFEKAKKLVSELRDQRIISQSFLDREVSI